MEAIVTGRFCARLAATPADIEAAQSLRHRCFRGEAGRDADAFDPICQHLLIEDRSTGALISTCRFLPLDSGAEIDRSYSAQFYDLSKLAGFAGPMIELGRFCVDPQASDAEILRLAWAALTRIVDAQRVQMLFGCSSFVGLEVGRHADALALLAARHLAPDHWQPGVRMAEVIRFGQSASGIADAARAWQGVPPLLKTYLAMGGVVSDHAVVDRDLGTLHVLTLVEIAAIPAARARALRQVAGAGQRD